MLLFYMCIIVFSEKRWRVVQDLTKAVRNRWQEFVTKLNTRQKWLWNGRATFVVDVVLYMEKGTPRNQRPLGRVTAVHPGPDCVGRIVESKSVENLQAVRHLSCSSQSRDTASKIPILDNVPRSRE